MNSLYPDRDASGFCERAARRDERVMRDASRMLRGEGPVNTVAARIVDDTEPVLAVSATTGRARDE